VNSETIHGLVVPGSRTNYTPMSRCAVEWEKVAIVCCQQWVNFAINQCLSLLLLLF
jgi:hypothetical protein